jgi:hypothetical protein
VAGASRGGVSTGEEGPGGGGPARARGGAWVGKDRARGSSTGALCTRFIVV